MVRLKDDGSITVKIIDLGLAKSLDEPGVQTIISTPGSFAGTPKFASPEQFVGIGADIRSDLYSLGVTLWEMVTGKTPFRGTPGKVMYQHLHSPLPLEQLESVPQPLIVLLEALLEKDPSRRFLDPGELLKAIPTITGRIEADVESPATACIRCRLQFRAPGRASRHQDDYALGHAEAELRRLTTQAQLIDPITRRFLEAAGIAEGMRVLDIGSGAGDVALLCGELVGPAGDVVGTDLALAAVERAELRAKNAESGRISFRHGDPAELNFDEPFDAIVGRYVLQFIPDPAQSLRRIVRHLRPGGAVVFHELDWDGARSSPPSPTYDQVCGWLSRTIEGAGAQVRLGARLASLFEDAGLPSPTLRLEAVIASGPRAVDVVHLVTDLVETQLPSMERLGIVAASQVEPSTLVDRILSEVGTGGTLMGRSEIGAWTTKP